jgi:hypothetical protein
MEAIETLTRCQEMSVDSKEDTHHLITSVSYDNTRDMSVKKEIDNAHTLEYNVVTDGPSGISMMMEDENVKVEHVAHTVCDSKMELTADVPYTERPYPVLLVQVKQELDDEESICPNQYTTVYRDSKLPGCIVSPADDTKFTNPMSKNPTDNNEVSVKQEVNNMHQGLTVINSITNAPKIDMEIKGAQNETTIHMVCASNLNLDAENQVTHMPLPVLLVNIKKEVDEEESECVEHEHVVLGSRKRHECKTCMKWFESKPDLTRHMVVHSCIQPYRCVACTKAFTQNTSLATHMANIHRGERHTCVTCIKSFTTNSYLSTHMATVHGGEKRYTCDTCMTTFADSSNLSRHMAVHSGI